MKYISTTLYLARIIIPNLIPSKNSALWRWYSYDSSLVSTFIIDLKRPVICLVETSPDASFFVLSVRDYHKLPLVPRVYSFSK